MAPTGRGPVGTRHSPGPGSRLMETVLHYETSVTLGDTLEAVGPLICKIRGLWPASHHLLTY